MSEKRTHKPLVSRKYRITGGQYTGHWCKVVTYHEAQDFVTVTLMDSWGKETKQQDAIPCKFLELH